MSEANVTFDPYPTPLSDYAVPVVVCRFDRAQPAGQRYTLLPNVRLLGMDADVEGPDVPVARFAYVLDDSDPSAPYPDQFDELWPLTAEGPFVVQQDDELVVLGLTPAGITRVLFDGFAQVPQTDLDRGGQAVTFTALAVPIRCWDEPIAGAYQRNAGSADSTAGDQVIYTGLDTRFNPDGNPNCTPDLYDNLPDGTVKTAVPAFLDPALIRDPDPRTYWTGGKCVRYLLTYFNPQSTSPVGEPEEAGSSEDAGDGTGVPEDRDEAVTAAEAEDSPVWVTNPDFTGLDDLLKARKPNGQFYDGANLLSFTAEDVIVRDYNASNKAWPDVVAEICGWAGAAFKWVLSQDDNAEPTWTIRFYRKDASTQVQPKSIPMQAAGNALDVTQTAVEDLHLARDAARIVNSIEVQTDVIEYEVSIVLQLGYVPLAADSSDANRTKYLLSALGEASSEDRDAYRLYVADEAGDGHYDTDRDEWVANDPIDLSAILGKTDADGPFYTQRLRKPEYTLFSKDPAGKLRRAQLSFSRDYTGAAPAVWDGSGHWQPIPDGWRLCKDRIGVYVIVENPEQWDLGVYTDANPQNPGRTLRGITSQSDPSSTDQNTQRFYLLLTCKIPGDQMILADAPKRDASPTKFDRNRRIDCKDHFKQEVIAANSWYNQTAKPVLARDDSKNAQAHAEGLRMAQEFPPIEGSVTIPWLSNAYAVGDRIQGLIGRDVSFQANAGTSGGEAPWYPFLTRITYDFSGESQRTTLHYSDARSGPQRG